LVKGAALCLLAAAVLCAIVLMIPDETDILLVSRDKNERLAALQSPKIVLVGGSNLAYGIDSPMIETATGCPVVNMGLNGFLGVRYMFAESRPHLEPGDFVVIAFEYDTFVSSADGRPDALFGVAKADPAALAHMNWDQRRMVLETLPYIAQRKAIRLMGVAERVALNALAGREVRPDYFPGSSEEQIVGGVEQRSGFNANGDVVAHLDMELPFAAFDGLDLTAIGLERQTIDETVSFVHDMEARGVHVLLSFTPTASDYYQQHEALIEDIYRRLAEGVPEAIRSRPSAFLFERAQFFDTVFHLRREARAARTQALITDMETLGFGSNLCSPEAALP
jgi:hypothetical protein